MQEGALCLSVAFEYACDTAAGGVHQEDAAQGVGNGGEFVIGGEGEGGGLAADVAQAETTAHWFGELEGGGVLFVGLGFGTS